MRVRAFELSKTGADFARRHIAEHPAATAAYLNEVNRSSMTEDQVAASVEREQAAWLAVGAASADALQWVYRPDYDPAKIATPRDYDAILRRYEPT
jgi:hypothetical protein